MPHGFLERLVAIHGADREQAIAAGVPVRDDAAELAYWDDYLQWSSGGEPVQALLDALAWCRENVRPRPDPPMVLRWGDVRLCNIVFGADLQPRAILDWDIAAVGVPVHTEALVTMFYFVSPTASASRV